MLELSQVHGCPYDTLRKRAAREKWSEAREEYRQALDLERARLVGEQHAKAAANVDRQALSAAQAGLALINRRLARIGRREAAADDQDSGRHVDMGEMNQAALGVYRWVRVRAMVTGQVLDIPDAARMEHELRQGERDIAERIHELAEARRLPMDAHDVHNPEPAAHGDA